MAFIRKRGNSHTLLESYRDENNEPRQRILANLGPYATVAEAIKADPKTFGHLEFKGFLVSEDFQHLSSEERREIIVRGTRACQRLSAMKALRKGDLGRCCELLDLQPENTIWDLALALDLVEKEDVGNSDQS